MKNVDKEVLNLEAAGVPTHAVPAAPAETTYPETINIKIARLNLIVKAMEDEDGNQMLDDKTGEVIYQRRCTITATEQFDGIIVDNDKYVVGKTTKLYYSAYYLMEMAKLSSKRLRIFLSKMEERHSLRKFSKSSMEALFEDAELVINRKFHKAGDTYIDADGKKQKYQADGFARDIITMIIPDDNIEMFKDEVADDIRFGNGE